MFSQKKGGEETRNASDPKRDGTAVKIEERDPVQFACDRRRATPRGAAPASAERKNRESQATIIRLVQHALFLSLPTFSPSFSPAHALSTHCGYSLLIWCDCLDSPILLTWTSRLKETVRSAGFQPETEAPVGSGGGKSAAGALEGCSSLKNSERCTSSILPAFGSRP